MYEVNEDCNTVTVYRDKSYELKGSLIIPTSVTYERTTYRVTSIGNGVFYGCAGLTSISIPDSVAHIGQYAFWGCTGLTSIAIPHLVTRIEDRVFDGCIGLTKISIPDSVTRIGAGAFAHCTGLTEISIPNAVTCIGAGAFAYCIGLTEITIPDSLTKIGDVAFHGCEKLITIICKAIIPPDICLQKVYADAYRHEWNSRKRKIVVYVPAQSVEAYRNDEMWKEFNIQHME